MSQWFDLYTWDVFLEVYSWRARFWSESFVTQKCLFPLHLPEISYFCSKSITSTAASFCLDFVDQDWMPLGFRSFHDAPLILSRGLRLIIRICCLATVVGKLSPHWIETSQTLKFCTDIHGAQTMTSTDWSDWFSYSVTCSLTFLGFEQISWQPPDGLMLYLL